MKHNIVGSSLILLTLAGFAASSTVYRLNLGSTDLFVNQRGVNPIPEASVECSPDVAKWWDQVRDSGLQLLQLSNQLDLAMNEWVKARQANPSMPEEQYHSLWEKTVSPIENAINERSEQFRGLLKEGIEKGYKPPVANANLNVLYSERPKYTEEARRHKIEGQVKLRAVFQADGRVTNIEVVKGLGYGLDEQAKEAVSKTVFLPRIVEGRLDSKATLLVAEFNLK